MLWLTWRNYRFVAILSVLVLSVLVIGFVADANAINTAIQQRVKFNYCDGDENILSCALPLWHSLALILVSLIPSGIGMFVGAPLLARIYERKTHLFTWTQSVQRRQWFTTTLGLLVGAIVVLFGVLSLVTTWWGNTFDLIAYPWSGFWIRGPVFVAYAVFCFLFGVMVGASTRRVLPAVFVTFVLLFIVINTVSANFYPFLLPAEQSTIRVTQHNTQEDWMRTYHQRSWILAQEYADQNGLKFSDLHFYCGLIKDNDIARYTKNLDACLQKNTITFTLTHYSYEKSFWLLQWIATGILVVLIGLCTAVTYWQVQRRVI